MSKYTKIPIPIKQVFHKTGKDNSMDYKAICVFSALGFFLDQDTYLNNKKFEVDKSYNWSYTPTINTVEEAVDRFAQVFETVIREQVNGKKVILPLSGGLDSRTQLVALKRLNADVSSFSYYFQDGYREDLIAEELARVAQIPFQSFSIKQGTLWGKLEELIEINLCLTDFTHPRQIIHIDEISDLGDVFSLGHWGDVLFDSDRSILNYRKDIYSYLSSKLIKSGGLDLGNRLWKEFGLEGNFEEYLEFRLLELWNSINVSDLEARFRIFKSKYWAPRWTSVNFNVFGRKRPITIPYYDRRLIDLSFQIPNEFLRNRRVQIEYIKKYGNGLGKVTWQDKKPFNLYNYSLNKFPYNFPFRVYDKLKRLIPEIMGNKFIQRNWELQFLGDENKSQIETRINSPKNHIIPQAFLETVLTEFYSNPSKPNAHKLSMLLTISQKTIK